ncbi:MAG: glycosyltransferase [Deltaproteobacteria bacterium]|nr:glycosyltransferase [Deltaproteobacteria bacterium]
MWLAILFLVPSFSFLAVGLFGIAWARRRPASPLGRGPSELAAISVLKPLSGADEELEENLETFFAQDGVRFELLFGVTCPTDPAVEVVERLIARHEGVRARLIIHAGADLANPKLANLAGLMPEARHDLVLISDSNVRAPSRYLEDLAATFAEPGVGLVTNIISGWGEETLGATLENATLNGLVAVGATAPGLLGDPAVVGKSMLFRRSVLESIGGIAAFGNVLAEDYILGRAIHHAGLSVRIGSVVLRNVNRRTTLRAYVARHLRWSQIRSRVKPLGFVLEPLVSPTVAAVVAGLGFGRAAGIAALLGFFLLRDFLPWLLLRGASRAWIPALTLPLRDAVLLAVWIATPFVKHVSWRGHPARIGPGSFLFTPVRSRTASRGADVAFSGSGSYRR